jgi:hypothetical protein
MGFSRIERDVEAGVGREGFKDVPFWIRMLRLSLTESEVSKMMSRKLSGSTS